MGTNAFSPHEQGYDSTFTAAMTYFMCGHIFYLHGMAMTMTDIPFTSFITGTPGVHVGAPSLV